MTLPPNYFEAAISITAALYRWAHTIRRGHRWKRLRPGVYVCLQCETRASRDWLRSNVECEARRHH